MTADKATFTGGYYPSKIFLKLTICLSGTYTKTWACVSQSLKIWVPERPPHTDNETTSPRIYVNRRTPSCMLMNFPDSDFQDRSASLRISNKSTAGARMQEQ